MRYSLLFFCFSTFLFANPFWEFVQFDLPEGWKCREMEKLMVCQDSERKPKVFLVAGIALPDGETLEGAHRYLTQMIGTYFPEGKRTKSKLLKSEITQMHGNLWSVTTHLDFLAGGIWDQAYVTIFDSGSRQIAIALEIIGRDRDFHLLNEFASTFRKGLRIKRPESEVPIETLHGEYLASSVRVKEKLISRYLRERTRLSKIEPNILALFGMLLLFGALILKRLFFPDVIADKH